MSLLFFIVGVLVCHFPKFFEPLLSMSLLANGIEGPVDPVPRKSEQFLFYFILFFLCIFF